MKTFTGHGVNNLFHCSPNVPHYAKNKAVGTMKPGMVKPSHENLSLSQVLTPSLPQAFTIEPVRFNPDATTVDNLVSRQMLNLGTNWEEIHWPDGWTATTIDGRRSAQFEETLLSVVPISSFSSIPF